MIQYYLIRGREVPPTVENNQFKLLTRDEGLHQKSVIRIKSNLLLERIHIYPISII